METFSIDQMKPLAIHELKSIYDMISLKGKTAFITGGAGGIGRSCGAAMAEAGANIVLVDIPQKQDLLKAHAEAITSRYRAQVLTLTGDVSSEADVLRVFEKTAGYFGTVDVVFSNAGITIAEDNAAKINLNDWQRMLDVNLTGMMLITRTGANLMRDHGHGGSIINTASMSGHIINRRPREAMAEHIIAYASTKAAVIQLSKSIALNYADYNIRCNSISPGIIVSGLHDNMDKRKIAKVAEHIPLARLGTLNEIMGLVLFLACELSSYITGSDFLIDGGYTVW
jgi:NAD(P)-dependent dehydrogenase (short-subunit alcohol dehydrogenase family)